MIQNIEIVKSGDQVGPVDMLWGSGLLAESRKHPNELLHYSDKLIQQQYHTAQQSIVKYLDTINRYENSESSLEKEQLLQEMLVLHRIHQHLKLILEILNKVQKEIEFTREKLHIALRKHSDDSELIRQRICWLERKLEEIINDNSVEKLCKRFSKSEVTASVCNELSEVETKKQEVRSRHKVVTSPPKSILLGGLVKQSRKVVTLPPISAGTTVNELVCDEADKYWQDDHHRFSYTENMGPLLEENPLSYHIIGLAVPGNYVDKDVFSSSDGSSTRLPWTSEQDPMAGNFDILRDDLEKLLKQIHRLQEKIYIAANWSLGCDGTKNTTPGAGPQSRKNSLTQSRALISITPVTSQQSENATKGLPHSITTESWSRASSSCTAISSTAKSSDRSFLPYKAFDPSKEVFHLTKTNITKKYPNCSNHWCDARPNEDGVDKQPTIVNQRDLHKKTKLKLFIPRRHREKSAVVRDLITPSSVTSNRSFRKINNIGRLVEKLKSSEGSALTALQKSRLQDLSEILALSVRPDDRVYAARALSSLGVTASRQVIPSLINSLSKETDANVRYEISKALTNLGEWHRAAIRELTMHLQKGERVVCLDVLEHLACSENASMMHLQIDEMHELEALIEVLRPMACSPDVSDEVAFQAAVCLGMICGIYDEESAIISSQKLLAIIQSAEHRHWHAQALEVLVRRLNNCNRDILKTIVSQMFSATKWQDRLAAALLFGYIGPARLFRIKKEDETFEILDHKLWDDVKREVRLGVSQAFTSLGMRNRLLETLDERIDDPNPEVRSHAVMSMSAAGIRSDKTLRSLIEMLGLDSSDYVRLQIIRTFHALAITDIRVVRALREREKGGGTLGREASKVLAALDVRITTAATSLPTSRQKSHRGRQQLAINGRVTTSSSWMSSPYGRDIKTSESSKRLFDHSRVGSRSMRYTPGSALGSTPGTAYSSPHYQVISTSVQKLRRSAKSMKRPESVKTSLTNASSIF